MRRHCRCHPDFPPAPLTPLMEVKVHSKQKDCSRASVRTGNETKKKKIPFPGKQCGQPVTQFDEYTVILIQTNSTNKQGKGQLQTYSAKYFLKPAHYHNGS